MLYNHYSSDDILGIGTTTHIWVWAYMYVLGQYAGLQPTGTSLLKAATHGKQIPQWQIQNVINRKFSNTEKPTKHAVIIWIHDLVQWHEWRQWDQLGYISRNRMLEPFIYCNLKNKNTLLIRIVKVILNVYNRATDFFNVLLL